MNEHYRYGKMSLTAQLGLVAAFEERRHCAHLSPASRNISKAHEVFGSKVLTCMVGSDILFRQLLSTGLPWHLKRDRPSENIMAGTTTISH
jgi:hypothetical protein